MTRPSMAISSPRRDVASGSTVAGGHVLGLDHHGRAAGRGDDDVRAQVRHRAGTAWVFSDHTCLPGSISWSRLPRALLAFGSVWRPGILVYGLSVRIGAAVGPR